MNDEWWEKKTNALTCSPSQVGDLGEWVSSTLNPYDGGPFILLDISYWCVFFAQNMPLISAASLCLMAFTSGRTFCFRSNLCPSHKNDFNFETWKVKCDKRLFSNSGYTHWGVAYAKFHKALRTW